ncbi:STAS domain-containing protein [Blastococcus haudaquaticus]|uniref:Anti-anti-sigma factor n=1 Tax=Blastococcus haudaquaticus TaxID=1938745 RepID=A0A286GVB8_9ACTN|nr:STAS domain-containing protein [Blastococcus haudaquaticus]SOD99441.1 anti-anti-sigma factor [Blastococcus haudaquaticus]
MLFAIERGTVAGRPSLTVRGELDLSTAPVLAKAVDGELTPPPPALVLDLTPTAFMDSSGARELVRIARKAAAEGVELHVIAPHTNGAVRLTIDLLDLGTVVPIVASTAEIPAGREARP